VWPDVATEGSGPSSERAGAGLEPLTGLGWLVSGKDVAVASLKVGEEIVVPLKVSLADHRQPALAPLRALLLFDIDGVIRDVGRTPAERSTTYKLRTVFNGTDDKLSPLDMVENADEQFGSYRRLAASDQFRYVHPFERDKHETAH